MSHLLLLFAKLEVEGVDTDGEVEENRDDDHRGDDGQGPGKSGGDGEVTLEGWVEDGDEPEGEGERNSDAEDVDKDGLPLLDPNKPNDGEEERDQAEGDNHTCPLDPVLPILGGLLKDVEADGDPVHLLLGAVHQLPKVCNISSAADEVGGDTDVDDVGQDADQSEDEGPRLQGDAAEKLLGVVELEAQLLLSLRHLDTFNWQPSFSKVS